MKHWMKAASMIAVSGAMVAAVPAQARPGNWHGGGGYSGNHGGHHGGWNSHGGRYRGSYGGHGYYGRSHYAGRYYGGRGYYGYPRYAYYGGYYGYPRGYGYRYYDRDDDAALAIGAGLLGVVVGTAIANDRRDDYYYDGY